VLIGVDWGTTRLRAALMEDDGTVVARSGSDKGLIAANGAFEAALAEVVGPWLASVPAPILMSGMIGSRQGWREAPYVAPPVTLAGLARGTVPVDTALGSVRIVPGVALRGETGPADVMRGEETEIFGALDLLGRTGGTFVMPGTHSKWVTVRDGAIIDFRTFMTGEVFAALKGHTILGRTMGEGEEGDAFARGLAVARALERPGDLLSALFAVRAEALFGRLAPGEGAAYLSGLLIGAEVAAAATGGEAILVGAAGLAGRYRTALEAAGVAVIAAPEDAAARGQALIAAAA
jgi:2-dehydro-3-deoxygalactonokinase